MKAILATILLALSFSAHAVDFTVSMTAGEATRLAAVCGVVKQTKDVQVPPQPRACTAAEVKQVLIEAMRRMVIDVEGAAAEKARGPAVVPAFNPS